MQTCTLLLFWQYFCYPLPRGRLTKPSANGAVGSRIRINLILRPPAAPRNPWLIVALNQHTFEILLGWRAT
jgi:hypothetical protein